MFRGSAARARRSLVKGSEALVSAAPRYQRPPSWIPGLRVLLAFYTPLLFGYAIDRLSAFIPVAIGAGILALVDPLGSTPRRAMTITLTTLAGALAFSIGAAVGESALLAIAFIFVAVWASGIATGFGFSGLRAGLWTISVAIFGISNAGLSQGLFSTVGILAGGAWALFLALGPFRNEIGPLVNILNRPALMRMAEPPLRDLMSRARDHLNLKTALGRHAVRMAATAALGLTISFMLGRPIVGWIAGAATLVTNPSVRSLRQRGLAVLIGALLGSAIAWSIETFAASTSIALLVAAPLLFFGANLRAVDFSTWTTLYTAFNLTAFFVAGGWSGNLAIYSGKILDTLIGVGLAVLVGWATFPYDERDRLDAELRFTIGRTLS